MGIGNLIILYYIYLSKSDEEIYDFNQFIYFITHESTTMLLLSIVFGFLTFIITT